MRACRPSSSTTPGWDRPTRASSPPPIGRSVTDGLLVMDRSDMPLSGTHSVCALLPWLESGVSLATVAVLLTSAQPLAELATFAVTVNVCDAPGSSVPIVHSTVPLASEHPLLADTNDSPL